MSCRSPDYYFPKSEPAAALASATQPTTAQPATTALTAAAESAAAKSADAISIGAGALSVSSPISSGVSFSSRDHARSTLRGAPIFSGQMVSCTFRAALPTSTAV